MPYSPYCSYPKPLKGAVWFYAFSGAECPIVLIALTPNPLKGLYGSMHLVGQNAL
mgnify:CR=1 FL=1